MRERGHSGSMQRQTAADALVDAGRNVAAAAGDGRQAPMGASDPVGTIAVGALLALVAARVPVVGVLLVGYVVTAARDPVTRVSGFDDWTILCVAGLRGSAVVAGAALPVVALVAGGDVVGGGATAAAGPALGVGVGVLAATTWHGAVVGIATLALGSDDPVISWWQLCRSGAGIRLSAALGAVTGTVWFVGFGLTAIPAVGGVLAAVAVSVGVVVAGRLVGQVVATRRTDRAIGGVAADIGRESPVRAEGGRAPEPVR